MRKIKRFFEKAWDIFYYDILSVICAIYFPIGLLSSHITIMSNYSIIPLLFLLAAVLSFPRAILTYDRFLVWLIS